jgi:hypothetical protein
MRLPPEAFVLHCRAADLSRVLATWDRLEARAARGERRAKAVRFGRDAWWTLTGGTGRADAPLFAPTGRDYYRLTLWRAL